MYSPLHGSTIVFAVLLSVLVITVRSKCPEKWLQIGCSCFLAINNSSQPLTWDEANEQCSSIHSARLAGIESLEENNILAGQQQSPLSSWIGLRAEVNSSFLLTNGKTAEFLIPVVHPKNTLPSPACVKTRPTNWQTSECDKKRRYICEQPVGRDCRNGWKKFKNSCYNIRILAKTFEDAENDCKKTQNAYLAEISTKEEYEFVKKEIYTGINNLGAWFGLHRAANTTQFRYARSEQPDYKALGVKFEPSDSKPKKSCVFMFIGASDTIWDAASCNQTSTSYICQTKAKIGFNITVVSVNETSANISWSILPPTCRMSGHTNFSLVIRDGKTEIHSTKITSSDSWWSVNDLKPETKHEIEITGNDVLESTKKFNTTEIKNHLSGNISGFNVQYHSVYAKIGESVQLDCAAKGEPPITFSWEKDKRKIKSYNETKYPHRRSTLSVKMINQTSYGDYICHIQDRFSNKTHKIRISDLPVPKDDSEDLNVIVIVILAIIVAILLFVTVCLVYNLWALNQKYKDTKRMNVTIMKMKTVSKDSVVYDKPTDTTPNKTSKDVALDDDTASYAALQRNDDEEEEDYYTHLNEPPLYVNAAQIDATI